MSRRYGKPFFSAWSCVYSQKVRVNKSFVLVLLYSFSLFLPFFFFLLNYHICTLARQIAGLSLLHFQTGGQSPKKRWEEKKGVPYDNAR